MHDFFTDIGEWITSRQPAGVARALVALALGWIASRTIRRHWLDRPSASQQQRLLARGLSYVILGIACAWALRELGFQLSALLGAAGVLTVALGFASQTSISNIISGLFLIGEQPFVAGDLIRVGDIVGEVLSVDLLSVKLRTFDNLLVRIPNETMIKSNVVNVTHFPIRRLDMKFYVAFKEDLDQVRDILLGVAEKNPLCLVDPAPLFMVQGFGASGVELQYSIWSKTENYGDLKTSMHTLVKRAFDAAGIQLPFPHMALHTGSNTAPLPITLVPPQK